MVALACHYAGVLDRLRPLRESWTLAGNPAWYGRCPVCGSKSPTHLRLWVSESGRLCAKCYGGKCVVQPRRDWWAALLSETGTAAGEWFPDGLPRGRRKDRPLKVAAKYDYRDSRGRLLFQCVKFDPPDAPDPRWAKNRYRRPAASHDEPAKVRAESDGTKWVWDGAGLDPDKLLVGEIVPAASVLYRLPELLAADVRQPVLYCEGEPDAETARALGFVAVTNPHGAGNLTPDMARPLAGRRVVVFEDNDEAGRRHVMVVAGILIGTGAKSLRVVPLRILPAGGDLTDWVRAKALPELPAGSARAAAWIAGQPAPARKAAATALAALVRTSPEWAALTADESGARLKAESAGPERLQDAMKREHRAA